MTTSDQYIHIALVGPVSAGKTTMLNTLLVARYGDMAMARTTATETIYYETDKHKEVDAKAIHATNTAINKNMMTKADGELKISDIKPLEYFVPPVHELLKDKLKPGVRLAIHDLPGLNDSQTKTVYHEYVRANFHQYDVVLFIVDVHSAMNTSDEKDILTLITNGIKANKATYGVDTRLMIVINKCDEMEIKNKKTNEATPIDDEFKQMVKQVHDFSVATINAILPGVWPEFICLSAEDAYIYRMYARNPKCEIDPKHRNKFGINEFGKHQWSKFDDKQKDLKFREKIKEGTDDAIELAGFKYFDITLANVLTPDLQFIYLLNHLKIKISSIVMTPGLTDIQMQEYLARFAKIRAELLSICKIYDKQETADPFFKTHFDKFVRDCEAERVQFLAPLVMTKDQESDYTRSGILREMYIRMMKIFSSWLVTPRVNHIATTGENMNKYLAEVLRDRAITYPVMCATLKKFINPPGMGEMKSARAEIIDEIVPKLWEYATLSWNNRVEFITKYKAFKSIVEHFEMIALNLKNCMSIQGGSAYATHPDHTVGQPDVLIFDRYYINSSFVSSIPSTMRIKWLLSLHCKVQENNLAGWVYILKDCLSELSVTYPKQVVDLDVFYASRPDAAVIHTK